MKNYTIRADYNKNSIIVYQAYRDQIAHPALKQQKFVPPFSLKRMTWIKPSFLWLMARSNWGQKKGQENILGIRISRQGWDRALSNGVLTTPELSIYPNYESWEQQFSQAKVHIQWDPERSIHGKKSELRSIQVGLSRFIIEEYVEDWTHEIIDYTPLVKKINRLIKQGKLTEAKRLLPKEKPYPIPTTLQKRLIPKNKF